MFASTWECIEALDVLVLAAGDVSRASDRGSRYDSSAVQACISLPVIAWLSIAKST